MTESARRAELADRLSGFLYGTILVLSVVLTGAKAFPDNPGRVAALVATTTIVFWLAHVYAAGLGHSIAHEEHLSFSVLSNIAAREASILGAGVAPVLALLLGAAGVLSSNAAVWVALGLGLAVLVATGVVSARVERLGVLGSVVLVLVNLGLGVVLILLKVLVVH